MWNMSIETPEGMVQLKDYNYQNVVLSAVNNFSINSLHSLRHIYVSKLRHEMRKRLTDVVSLDNEQQQKVEHPCDEDNWNYPFNFKNVQKSAEPCSLHLPQQVFIISSHYHLHLLTLVLVPIRGMLNRNFSHISFMGTWARQFKSECHKQWHTIRFYCFQFSEKILFMTKLEV